MPYQSHTSSASSEPVAGYRAATPADRPAQAVFHGVGVQLEFFGGQLVAGVAPQKDPQGVPQPGFVLVIGSQIAKHLGYPPPGRFDVVTQ